jgi:hypothetical protein
MVSEKNFGRKILYMKYKKIRLFIASPGDVIDERVKIEVVISGIKPLIDEVGLGLEILNGYESLPGMGRAQELILSDHKPETWDIFIGILWHRFGTKTGKNNLDTNRAFSSGTEEEFHAAYNLWMKFKRPRILFYQCIRAINPELIDLKQYQKVKKFLANFLPGSEHPGLLQKYDTLEDFAKKLQGHLIKIILELGKTVSAEITQSLIPSIPNTLPRRNIFFGRKLQIDKVLRALDENIRGWGVAIDGIGGIGKTSLAIEVAYICKERDQFDAYIFVTAKRDRLETTGITEITLSERTLEGVMTETARALGLPGIANLNGISLKQRELLSHLSSKKSLLIFDNLETLTVNEQNSIGEFLLNLPQNCKAIVTTRHHSFTSAITLRLNKLAWEEAKELIESQITQYPLELKILANAGEAEWKKLYDETGGSPLALIWIIGIIRVKRQPLIKIFNLLRDGTTSNDLTEFIYREAEKNMDEYGRIVLHVLSLFGGPGTFEALNSTTKLNRQTLESSLDRLRALALVDLANSDDNNLESNDQYTLNALTLRFALSDLCENKKLEFDLKIRYCRYWFDYTRRYNGSDKQDLKNYEKLELEWHNINKAMYWLHQIGNISDDSIKNKSAAQLMVNFNLELYHFLWRSGRWDDVIIYNSLAYSVELILERHLRAGWPAYITARTHYFRNNIPECEIWTNKCAEVWSSKKSSLNEQAYILRLQGNFAELKIDYPKAQECLLEAVKLWEKSRNSSGICVGFNDLGNIATKTKKFPEASKYYKSALLIANEFDNEASQIYIPINLGNLLFKMKKYSLAKIQFESALVLAKNSGNFDLIAQAKYGMSKVLISENHLEKAKIMLKEAIIIYRKILHVDLYEAEKLLAT